MIVNTLLLKFKEGDVEVVRKAKEKLLGMKGRIDVLSDIQVKANIRPGGFSYDLMLITKFDSMKDFDAYLDHPVHVEVADYVTKNIVSGASVCYEA